MKKKFKTIDILAFYFGKALTGDQYQPILEINAFLMGSKIEVEFPLPVPYVAMRKPLCQQIPWLNRLVLPDRKPKNIRTEWLQNLLRNHGETIELEPFSKEVVAKILEK